MFYKFHTMVCFGTGTNFGLAYSTKSSIKTGHAPVEVYKHTNLAISNHLLHHNCSLFHLLYWKIPTRDSKCPWGLIFYGAPVLCN